MRRFTDTTIGLVGGGQLARMMAQDARRLGLATIVLDPDPNAPAAQLADAHVRGDVRDARSLERLVCESDVTTFDLEDVDAASLEGLVRRGHPILPAPALLRTIQDKLSQREALAAAGLPGPRFGHVAEPSREAFERFGLPLVQKLRRGGYDGRGVVLLRDEGSLGRALPGDSLVEELVPIRRELAVMVARSTRGEVASYPVVEMVFDPEANLLELLLAPARIDAPTAATARRTACRAVEALGGVGIFGVELFESVDGEILVNEIAPRPHNSGHYTIEACATSQFEQHLRAILGLPLGSTEQLRPAAMVNLLGSGRGRPRVEGLNEALSVAGASIHLYGKTETRPRRKMGHVTVLDASVDCALEKARRVRHVLKIDGEAAA
jgi:5-(carboxyamino)imidazole ribonucleotide synthase